MPQIQGWYVPTNQLLCDLFRDVRLVDSVVSIVSVVSVASIDVLPHLTVKLLYVGYAT
jgi:hypothetical protein